MFVFPGPLSSALSTRFSCRKMVVFGGILTAAGWVITGFMPRLEYMFITYGLLAGNNLLFCLICLACKYL